MKREKQIHKTKLAIHDAFLALLENKDFYSITFAEIAEEAKISRMTVYRYFKDCDAIIDFGIQENVRAIVEIINALENPTLKDVLILRFKSLQESRYTQILYAQNKMSDLAKRFGVDGCDFFANILPVYRNNYLSSFILGGIDSVTEKWLQNGMQEHYEEIVQNILFMINATKEE